MKIYVSNVGTKSVKATTKVGQNELKLTISSDYNNRNYVSWSLNGSFYRSEAGVTGLRNMVLIMRAAVRLFAVAYVYGTQKFYLQDNWTFEWASTGTEGPKKDGFYLKIAEKLNLRVEQTKRNIYIFHPNLFWLEEFTSLVKGLEIVYTTEQTICAGTDPLPKQG